MRKSIVRVIAAASMLFGSVMLATPAHAESRQLVMLWQDAQNSGFHQGLTANWAGACDRQGYMVELPHFWKGKVSSFSRVSMATNCNYIRVYKSNWEPYSTRGALCWEGYISKAKSLPSSCNDSVWGVRVSREGYTI